MPNAFADALGAQSAAQMLNGIAGPASSALGALTSMQGANSMMKGKQQMQCCQQGCTGAGQEATANGAAQNAASQGIAGSLPTNDGSSGAARRTEPVEEIFGPHAQRKAIDESLKFCSSLMNGKSSLVINLFHPARVEAGAGCADAMSSMAQGAMQMLSGLAGMMAGMMGNKNSGKAGTNANNLSEMPIGSIGSSNPKSEPTPVGSTNLNSTGNTTPVQIDPSLLRDGKANSIATEFERNFGIPRDDFAKALASGADMRALLMNAPKNAFTADELNKAFAAAKSMSAEQKAAALAGLGDLQKEMLDKYNSSLAKAEAGSAAGAGGGKSASRSPSSSTELDDLEITGAQQAAVGAGDTSQLSPELQAALAERDREQKRSDATIFEVVHLKYQEKMRMIYGFDTHGHSIGGKGVANAEGF